MKSTKYLGIWMDHSVAHIMELKDNTIVSNTIESETHQGEKQNYGKDESLKHSKEQKQLSEYFDKLTNVIKDYNDVLLFGPTDAKNELFNLLKTERLFNDIKITVKNADKLTENQMHAFVKEHFGGVGK
jgi:stalled ribosome rescue protein Dom34